MDLKEEAILTHNDKMFNKKLKDSGVFSDPGYKDDIGKPDLDLVLGAFAKALYEVGRVGTFGASKYSRHGWKKVSDGKERYSSAMLRHYFMEESGEAFDEDSKLLHASHLAWNALSRLELLIREREEV